MRRRLAILLAAVALALTGCGGSSGDSSAASESGASPRELGGTLTVFAAASLTDVFDQLGGTLEKKYPGLSIRFNFAGSQALAAQIAQGAPADVFASANAQQMKVVTDAGLQSGQPRVFTENVLEIAVPKGNPGKVTGLADFARPELKLAVCAPSVPCGAAAAQVFRAAGVDAQPDTQEEDVKAALTKVQLGEVDAALVYATDIKATDIKATDIKATDIKATDTKATDTKATDTKATDTKATDARAAGRAVEGIPFPQANTAVNEYPICALKAAPNPKAAQAFVALVLSDEGQRVLAAAGFRAPTS